MAQKTKTKQLPSSSFTSDVVKFYENFNNAIIIALENIITMEKNHKTQFKVFKDIQTDPLKLMDLSDKLTMEEKGTLFDILVKMGNFQMRFNNLFKLSIKEKQTLIKDLKKFNNQFNQLVTTKGN